MNSAMTSNADAGWYAAPLSDIRATLDHMIGAEKLSRTERFAEATPETVGAVLSEIGRVTEQVWAPLNRIGDVEGSRLENGVVRTPAGFDAGYRAIAEGGWVGLAAPAEQGGMGLPLTLLTAVNEMCSSSCLSLSLCPLLSQGAIEAIEAHGTDAQKALYLPKLISGEWTGTMNLTEPQAGSDVGALKTRAERRDDGAYAITGSKIFISWGDHDLTDNIVHLVLARLPDAPAGPKGVTLFVVPKFLPDSDGAPGDRNGVTTVSLDHKMGLHASPTCVLAYEKAAGWRLGEENAGLACMFTMMNNARLGVAMQAIGAAEGAMQRATAFALERVQGQPAIGETISGHPDVRRMLLAMRTLTQAARAIAYDCALHLDLAKAAADGPARAQAAAMAAFLTPIAKAFGTDVGAEVSHLCVQVHGGMGYIEETGVAQFSRDVRVTSIYEGTNGIQAMDLVGRKLSVDGGATALAYVNRCDRDAEDWIAAGGAIGDIGRPLAQAVQAARRATEWMTNAEPADRAAGGAAYLRALALLGGASYLGRAAAASGDSARRAMARFFAQNYLPEAEALARASTAGAAALFDISDDELARFA